MAFSGIERIYNEDFESQQVFIREWVKGCRTSPHEILFKAKAFYVPNNDYMFNYFGSDSLSSRYDIYNWDKQCIWHGNIVFPIRSVAGTIVGFAGFDPEIKLKKMRGEVILDNAYRYSVQEVFNRSHYVYMLPGVFEKSVKDGYIVITDGIFDMTTLAHFGFNSGSLLGSILTDQILMVLGFIDRLYIAYDNDNAGLELFKKLNVYFPGRVFGVNQNVEKDIDGVLSGPYSKQMIDALNFGIANKCPVSLHIKPQRSRMSSYNNVR